MKNIKREREREKSVNRALSRYTCVIFREDDRTKMRRTATFDLRKVCNLFHLCNLLPPWQKTAFKRTTMKDWMERADAAFSHVSSLRLWLFARESYNEISSYLSIRVVVIIENFLYFILYSRAHVICHSSDTCLAIDKKHYN